MHIALSALGGLFALSGCATRQPRGVLPTTAATAAPSPAPLAPAATLPAPPPAALPCEGVRSARVASGDVTAFIVSVPAEGTGNTGAAPPQPSRSARQNICIIHGNRAAELLVAGANSKVPEHALVDLDHLVLTPNAESLYFTSSAWATTKAAHVVQIATGKERFFVDGEVLAYLGSGPYAGHLLARHYRLDDAHPFTSPLFRGRVQLFTVLDATGRQVKVLPENAAARAKALGLPPARVPGSDAPPLPDTP